jgi:hypothetical protein
MSQPVGTGDAERLRRALLGLSLAALSLTCLLILGPVLASVVWAAILAYARHRRKSAEASADHADAVLLLSRRREHRSAVAERHSAVLRRASLSLYSNRRGNHSGRAARPADHRVRTRADGRCRVPHSWLAGPHPAGCADRRAVCRARCRDRCCLRAAGCLAAAHRSALAGGRPAALVFPVGTALVIWREWAGQRTDCVANDRGTRQEAQPARRTS